VLTLDRHLVDDMIAHARKEAPNECCGIVAGKDGRGVKLFRAGNAEASPYRYNMDSQDLFRIYSECDENGWEFLAIYHSHVATEAYPSRRDIDRATAVQDFFDGYYVLVTLKEPGRPQARAFRVRDGHVAEEELQEIG
jgi:proteasome lid subunit RPN8/RPN11